MFELRADVIYRAKLMLELRVTPAGHKNLVFIYNIWKGLLGQNGVLLDVKLQILYLNQY